MGLLSFLVYRKRREKEDKDSPLIARVKLRTPEEVDKAIVDHINNNDVCILGARKYRPMIEKDDKAQNESIEKEL